jgi:uncharacterized protein
LELVDVHAHIGRFEGYDLSEETLLAETEGAGIHLALVSNIDGAAVPGKSPDLPEPVVNAAAERFVRRYPERFRGLLWARPDRGDASALEPFTGARLPHPAPPQAPRWTRRVFVGIKLHPEMNAVAADDPRVDPYLDFAARHALPVVAHSDGQVDAASPARLLALARRHPEVPVVLYHTGFQGPHEPAIEAAAEALHDGSANLWLETAQLPPEWALRAVERVGPGRVLFGTDATFHGRGHYARYAPLLAALASTLDPDDLARVRSENARHLFRLDAAHDAAPTRTPDPDAP